MRFHNDAWKPQHPRSANKAINGADTETDEGYARLLTVSTPITVWYAEICSFDDFLQAIWTREIQRNINFFYNVDFDFSAISKWMGEEALTDLAVANETVWVSRGTQQEEFTIRWIPNKAFSISIERRGRRVNTARFYDNAQFYERKRLAKAALLVGEEKLDFDTSAIDWKKYDACPPPRDALMYAALNDKTVRKKLINTMTYRERLLTYGMHDAVICRKLGERLHRAVNQVVPINEYFSTATIAQAFFLSRLSTQIRLPPKPVLAASLAGYGGGRFELVRRGYFPKVWYIDINSAYPQEFAQLPATGTKTGHWARTQNGQFDPDALFGFYEIETETHGYFLSPIMHRLKDTIFYPHGKHHTWVEKSELGIIDQMGFKAKIIDGYEYYDTAPVYPFGFIPEDYNKRKELEQTGYKDLAYVYKIALNSAYGKTIQLTPDITIESELPTGFDDSRIVREIERKDGSVLVAVRHGWKAGKMFNPIYAATITARVRTRLLETVLRNNLESSLIGFATDSIFLKRPPPERILGKGLGSWKIESGPCEGLFIGSGVYALKAKNYAINHFRGFHTKHDLFESLRNGITSFSLESPVKLREGVRGGRRDPTTPISWRDIGKFMPKTKTMDLNFDRKRVWDRPVKNARDLLKGEIGSKPVVLV